MKALMIFLSCLLTMQSCDFFRFMATKEPVAKSVAEVNGYLQQENITYYDYSILLPKESVDSLSATNHALNLWKLERNVPQSSIQLRVYDSSGQLVNGYSQCYGNMNRVNILSEKDSKQFEQFPNNYSLLFSSEIELWNIPSEQQEAIEKANSHKKYTFVIYWNIWSNYYSKVIFKNLEKYLSRFQMREEVLIILVNTDNLMRANLQ